MNCWVRFEGMHCSTNRCELPARQLLQLALVIGPQVKSMKPLLTNSGIIKSWDLIESGIHMRKHGNHV